MMFTRWGVWPITPTTLRRPFASWITGRLEATFRTRCHHDLCSPLMRSSPRKASTNPFPSPMMGIMSTMPLASSPVSSSSSFLWRASSARSSSGLGGGGSRGWTSKGISTGGSSKSGGALIFPRFPSAGDAEGAPAATHLQQGLRELGGGLGQVLLLLAHRSGRDIELALVVLPGQAQAGELVPDVTHHVFGGLDLRVLQLAPFLVCVFLDLLLMLGDRVEGVAEHDADLVDLRTPGR